LALRTAVEVWATSSTSGTTRRGEELIVKKRKVVDSFFTEVGRDPSEVTEFGRRHNPHPDVNFSSEL
jgi:hypothetical protein